MRVDVVAMGRRVRTLREQAGMSQGELGDAAGISRQAVGALEAGRHLPRIDAAVGLASALDVPLEQLVGSESPRAVSVSGDAVVEGQPVRAARVDDRVVCVPLSSAGDGESWHAPDAVIRGGRAQPIDGAALDGLVLLGCDPALGVFAELGPARTGRILAVPASSRSARVAVTDKRAHGALVHDRGPLQTDQAEHVLRLRLARWRTGLAAPPGRRRAIHDALVGRGTVIQRDPGAGAQTAYTRALARDGHPAPPGPRASGHLDAARRAHESGVAAVTIEPAAVAMGLHFHALETHLVEVWLDADAVDHPGARALRELIASPRFRERIRRFPGYALDETA